MTLCRPLSGKSYSYHVSVFHQIFSIGHEHVIVLIHTHLDIQGSNCGVMAKEVLYINSSSQYTSDKLCPQFMQYIVGDRLLSYMKSTADTTTIHPTRVKPIFGHFHTQDDTPRRFPNLSDLIRTLQLSQTFASHRKTFGSLT